MMMSDTTRTVAERPIEIADQSTKSVKRRDLHLMILMLVLTFSAGIVDAVGYLALDHVFIGNMTGNVVILGMALAGGNELPVMGPFAALLCFALGAAISGLMLRRNHGRWSTTVTVLLVVASLLLGVSALLDLLPGPLLPSQQLMLLMSSLAALAMGIQAFVARELAVREVTTVVVTSTLTTLAGGLFTQKPGRGLFNRRSLAIALILVGATAGALLLLVNTALAMGLAAVILLAVAVTGHLIVDRVGR